jgi:GT2 family glycosyltransferase
VPRSVPIIQMRGRIHVIGASGFIGVAVCKELLSLGFDERYFMYVEDVDICRRMHQRYETIYFPEVAIYHGYEKGSYRNVCLMTRHIVSALQYFQKWGWFSDEERIVINQKATAS